MKKFIKFLAIAVIALAMVGCKAKPVAVLSQAKADYTEILSEVVDSNFVRFCEIEMVLDRPISNLNQGEDVQVLSTQTVVQTDTIVRFIDRTYDNKGRVIEEERSTVVGSWMGDDNLGLDSLALDLSDAMKVLQETNTTLPEADKVVLRRPLMPPFDAYYIFGTYGTFFVFVNAVTGEVSTETPDSDIYIGMKKEEVAE